jgi:peptidoglycan/LPS O-acetylase OafA/YrhL
MTTVPVRERDPIDLIAAAWGGLVASVGLMLGADRDWPLRLGLAAVFFLVGGFLSGVRARSRRRLHGLVAAALGYVVFAVFVALAGIVSTAVDRNVPDPLRGGLVPTALAAACAVAFALIGASLAERWLRPSRRRRSPGG